MLKKVVLISGMFLMVNSNMVYAEQSKQGSNWKDSRYTVHNNGTVTDKITKLTWKRCAEGQSNKNSCSGESKKLTWRNAQEHAKGVVFAGKSDWRVPNIAELKSLANPNRTNPAINSNIFPNTHGKFWSSERFVPLSDSAWKMDFSTGEGDYILRYFPASIRLVRGKEMPFKKSDYHH